MQNKIEIFKYYYIVVNDMKLYKKSFYPEEKNEVLDKNVIDILISDTRSAIYQKYYDKDQGRLETKYFAINYGWKIGDRSPVLRGFEFEERLYEINSKNQLLIIQPKKVNFFYDGDKILPGNRFVFECNPHKFIEEFLKKGYEVTNK